LKEFKAKDGSKLSLEQIIREITSLIIAGHETTANTTVWAIYILSNMLDMQAQLRTSFLEKFAEGVTYDAIKEYSLANCVMLETIRLIPTVPFLPRHA